MSYSWALSSLLFCLSLSRVCPSFLPPPPRVSAALAGVTPLGLAASSRRSGAHAAWRAVRASGDAPFTARYSSSSPEPSPTYRITSARDQNPRPQNAASCQTARRKKLPITTGNIHINHITCKYYLSVFIYIMICIVVVVFILYYKKCTKEV